MTARYEIPTQLGAPDAAAFGMTMRQLLLAASGAALAYAAWVDLPLPGALRLGAAALVLLLTLALVLWRPQGRELGEWALVLARYHARPRLSVGRPARRRDVVIPRPAARRGSSGRGGGTGGGTGGGAVRAGAA